MSTEAMWIEPRPAPAGLRCRYCARILAAATEPDRMTPHCGAAGCRVCTECATGATSVSPVRAINDQTARPPVRERAVRGRRVS